MGRPIGSKTKAKIKLPFYTPEVVKNIKLDILKLFDNGTIENLSDASEHTGVSKLMLYSWRKSDKAWRDALNQAEEPIADRLLQEILADTMPNGKTISMPYVTARLFRVKKIRPEYRDAYHFVVDDSKALEHLEALRALAGKIPVKNKPESTQKEE